MSSGHVKFLLLGGGSAAASAAEAIRSADPAGEVLLVSAESSRPYHRAPLARGYLRRELRPDDLFTHPANWYAENNISLRTGVRALALDMGKHKASLSSGAEVLFDQLLIATGASPRHLDIPGNTLPGTIHLRTFEDADRIHHAADVALAVSKGRVAVIGSGLVAAEVAASLALRKGNTAGKPLAVTLLCSKSHLFEGLVGENAARAVTRALESLGVTVKAGSPITALEGDGRVQRVILAGNSAAPIDCDLTVIAEGWLASRELLRGTSLAAEKAILVDERGRTNLPGIYAAGECAAMFDPVFGKHRVLDHWDVTVSRGLVVGANMAGLNRPWEGVTVHRAEVGPTRVVVMGEPRFTERRIVRDAGDQGLAEFAVDKQGQICAAALVNWRPPEGIIESMVRARVPIAGREEELRDPNRAL